MFLPSNPLFPPIRSSASAPWFATLEPSGNILLLRARDPEGRCIATGIYPGFNQIAEFWGNASFRSHQSLRPNEACHWYAMRYWKKRGATIFDWGGEGTYKEKYGCTPHRVPWFTKSRYQIVGEFATRLAPCLRASKNFSDGCKATAPPPTAARPKNNEEE